MAVPEKASESLNQTELKIKSFRKSMMALLFEWQDLETCFESTNKCFQENFQVQESVSHKSIEQKEKEFHLFQENQVREMEIKKEKLGFAQKEIDLREKKVEEQEKLVEFDKEQVEGEKKIISDQEKHIKQCLEDIELKEKNLETIKKELELKEKELNLRENQHSRCHQVGSCNQNIPHINESETLFDNQQISTRKLRSRAWMHFTKIVNHDGHCDKAKCNYCHKLFGTPGGSTGGLLRHIFDGRCPAYQNHEVLGQTGFQQSIGVQNEEPSIRQCDVGDETRTPVMKCQDPILHPSKLQTRLCTESQVSSSKTCAIHDTALRSDLNYQPRQLKYPHKDQSDLLLEEQPLKTGSSDTSQLLTDCSGSQASRENRTGMGNSDNNCQDFQVRPRSNFETVGAESGDTRAELNIQGRKRNRENESYNYLYHEDVEDLSTPVKIEEAWYNNSQGDNAEKRKDPLM